MKKVFVYGTLKRGQGNNHVFPNGSKYVCDGVCDGKLVHLGGFPGLLKGTSGKTYGEVWEVPHLQSLDYLEGNGSFYTREPTIIQVGDEEITAWVYKLPKERYDSYPEVDGGVWI